MFNTAHQARTDAETPESFATKGFVGGASATTVRALLMTPEGRATAVATGHSDECAASCPFLLYMVRGLPCA